MSDKQVVTCESRIRRPECRETTGKCRRHRGHGDRSRKSSPVPAAAVSSRYAALSPADIAVPIRSLLAKYRNIRVLKATAQSIDTANRKVVTDIVR